MKSMTGYGKDTLFTDNYNISVEIKSLNNRFFDLNVSIPRELSSIQNDLKSLFNDKVFRGKFDLTIDILDKRVSSTIINEPKLKSYSNLLKQAAKIGGFELQINIQDLISEPDMLISENNDNQQLIEDIKLVVKNALKNHQIMALKEGDKMADYIKKSLKNMNKSLTLVEKAFPKYKIELFDKLVKKMEELIHEAINDDDKHKILVETSIKIDRSDITEEIIRLRSHIEKFESLLNVNNQALGKKFNFILQEMHREINTIGSKYNSNLVFDHILFIKEEIEKCREIIQNVE